jgi:hypothetical protein
MPIINIPGPEGPGQERQQAGLGADERLKGAEKAAQYAAISQGVGLVAQMYAQSQKSKRQEDKLLGDRALMQNFAVEAARLEAERAQDMEEMDENGLPALLSSDLTEENARRLSQEHVEKISGLYEATLSAMSDEENKLRFREKFEVPLEQLKVKDGDAMWEVTKRAFDQRALLDIQTIIDSDNFGPSELADIRDGVDELPFYQESSRAAAKKALSAVIAGQAADDLSSADPDRSLPVIAERDKISRSLDPADRDTFNRQARVALDDVLAVSERSLRALLPGAGSNPASFDRAGAAKLVEDLEEVQAVAEDFHPVAGVRAQNMVGAVGMAADQAKIVDDYVVSTQNVPDTEMGRHAANAEAASILRETAGNDRAFSVRLARYAEKYRSHGTMPEGLIQRTMEWTQDDLRALRDSFPKGNNGWGRFLEARQNALKNAVGEDTPATVSMSEAEALANMTDGEKWIWSDALRGSAEEHAGGDVEISKDDTENYMIVATDVLAERYDEEGITGDVEMFAENEAARILPFVKASMVAYARSDKLRNTYSPQDWLRESIIASNRVVKDQLTRRPAQSNTLDEARLAMVAIQNTIDRDPSLSIQVSEGGGLDREEPADGVVYDLSSGELPYLIKDVEWVDREAKRAIITFSRDGEPYIIEGPDGEPLVFDLSDEFVEASGRSVSVYTSEGPVLSDSGAEPNEDLRHSPTAYRELVAGEKALAARVTPEELRTGKRNAVDMRHKAGVMHMVAFSDYIPGEGIVRRSSENVMLQLRQREFDGHITEESSWAWDEQAMLLQEKMTAEKADAGLQKELLGFRKDLARGKMRHFMTLASNIGSTDRKREVVELVTFLNYCQETGLVGPEEVFPTMIDKVSVSRALDAWIGSPEREDWLGSFSYKNRRKYAPW